MYGGEVFVSTDIGTEEVSVSLPVPAFQSMYDVQLSVKITGSLVLVRLNPGTCNEGPHCLATAIASGAGRC